MCKQHIPTRCGPRLPTTPYSRSYSYPVQVFSAIFRIDTTDEVCHTEVVLTGRQISQLQQNGDTPDKAIERALAAQGLILLELGGPEDATVSKRLEV